MDFLNTQEKKDRRMIHLPMGRFGEAVEVARGALFCTCLATLSQCMKPLMHFFHSGKRREQLRDRMYLSLEVRAADFIGIYRARTLRSMVVSVHAT